MSRLRPLDDPHNLSISIISHGGVDYQVTVSVTFTSTGAPPPDAGVIVTVVVYVPADKLLASAVKVTVEDFPPTLLPLAGLTVSQAASDGVFDVHVKMPPPVLVTVLGCGV